MKMDEARNHDERVADSQEQAEIDAAFSAMVDDAAYQSEARMITTEFSEADWEAFQLSEDADTP